MINYLSSTLAVNYGIGDTKWNNIGLIKQLNQERKILAIFICYDILSLYGLDLVSRTSDHLYW